MQPAVLAGGALPELEARRQGAGACHDTARALSRLRRGKRRPVRARARVDRRLGVRAAVRPRGRCVVRVLYHRHECTSLAAWLRGWLGMMGWAEDGWRDAGGAWRVCTEQNYVFDEISSNTRQLVTLCVRLDA